MKLLNISKIVVIIYFVNLFLYSLFSLAGEEEIVRFFWFIRIPILLLLYLITSKERKFLYFFALFCYQLASVLFFLDSPDQFVYGTIASVLFKVCLVLLIVSLVNKKNNCAIGMASIPFFVLYLYVIELVIDSLGEAYYLWIINAFLTSFIGGVAIINHMNNSDKKSYWLLISAILFIVQIGTFFINKFYVKDEGIYQMVILSYGISHFTFFKFLILKEKEESIN
ncbi:MAG: hypothetical protein ABI426_07950 [Flavobacterium sp.]